MAWRPLTAAQYATAVISGLALGAFLSAAAILAARLG